MAARKQTTPRKCAVVVQMYKDGRSERHIVTKHAPSNLKDLMFWVKRVWVQEITPETCHRLAMSMPHRIQTVLKNKGLMTKY